MIEEKGPWAAAYTNEKAFIESDDFTHDVRLYISGDFESIEQRVEYAEEIAKRLNAFTSRDVEVIERGQIGPQHGRGGGVTREQIIAAAMENDLVQFYALAFEAGRVAEREECAKVCDEIAEADNGYWCAMTIRARGTKAP